MIEEIKMKMKTKKKGFTLIELLVCLLLLVLMMLLIFRILRNKERLHKRKVDEAIVNVVKTQQQSYMLQNNTKKFRW